MFFFLKSHQLGGNLSTHLISKREVQFGNKDAFCKLSQCRSKKLFSKGKFLLSSLKYTHSTSLIGQQTQQYLMLC